MHDIPWFVSHLDPDTARSTVVKIIHGNWRRDDPSRLQLDRDKDALVASGYNVELIAAYLPQAFGTHHTKMMVLFSHDDTAQVVIHTANMIPHDWENMTQAVWRSPTLPLLSLDAKSGEIGGIGRNFKDGLMGYLAAYEKRTERLVEQLVKYDFRDVRAVFIGHVPGNHALLGSEGQLLGWGKLRRVLMRVGRGGGWGVGKAGGCVSSTNGGGEMVMQVLLLYSDR